MNGVLMRRFIPPRHQQLMLIYQARLTLAKFVGLSYDSKDWNTTRWGPIRDSTSLHNSSLNFSQGPQMNPREGARAVWFQDKRYFHIDLSAV